MTDLPKPTVNPAPGSTDGEEAFAALLSLAQAMHRGHHWEQGEDKAMRCVKAPLTKTMLRNHLERGQPIGLCPIAPGTSTTRVACLDLDSHKGEVPWDEMTLTASNILDAANSRGLAPQMFRSTGGSGVHLIFMWDAPQDAYSVRETLRELLESQGYTTGTRGVVNREIEVFPKQDSVPEGGYGSMFVLPMSRRSVPLDDKGGEIALPYLVPSHPVLPRQRPERPAKASTLTPAEIAEVRAAVEALPAQDYDYEHWRNIVFAIHSATGGSDEGLELAKLYNAKHPHERGPEWLVDQVWPYVKDDGTITAGTLFHHARKAGWGAPDAEGFEDCSQVEDAGPPGSTDGFESTKGSEGEQSSPIPRAWVDLTTLDLIPPEPRDWLVRDWLAAGVVHTLFSRGGLGKSLLAQQLATAVTCNQPWLGLEVSRPGPVLAYFCEEDENELRWRQWHINRRLEIDCAGLTEAHLEARLGMDNLLVLFDDKRKAKASKFYKLVQADLERVRPRLLILDNAAQLFAGVENDRAMVTQFVNALARLARSYSCAVLLLGHTAKAEDSSYSGSSAWENVCRVRWFLTRTNDGTSDLSIEKSNIGPRTKLALNWNDHIFERFDRATQATETTVNARDVVLAAVREITSGGAHEDAGRAMSMFKNRAEFAPKVIVARGLNGGVEPALLERAIQDLIGMGLLTTEAEVGRKPNGTARLGLGLTNQGLAYNPLKGNESADLA